jgi:hypothetical protein
MMGEIDYTEVESVYTPAGDIPDLILKAESPEGAYLYTSFHDQDDIPEYLKAHVRRNREAEEEVEENTKLSRLVDDHLNQDAEHQWRTS